MRYLRVRETRNERNIGENYRYASKNFLCQRYNVLELTINTFIDQVKFISCIFKSEGQKRAIKLFDYSFKVAEDVQRALP